MRPSFLQGLTVPRHSPEGPTGAHDLGTFAGRRAWLWRAEALDAVDLGLETVYERFHPSRRPSPGVVGPYLSEAAQGAFRRPEEMLKKGQRRRSGGERAGAGPQLVRLQPQGPGMQYYLSGQDLTACCSGRSQASGSGRSWFWSSASPPAPNLFFLLRKQYLRRRARRAAQKGGVRERTCPERTVRRTEGPRVPASCA